MIDGWNKHLLDEKNINKEMIVEVDKNTSFRSYTFKDVKKKIDEYKTILENNGFKKGMRLGVEDDAGVDFICKIWACFNMGVIWASIPIDTPLKRKENQLTQAKMHGYWRSDDSIEKMEGGEISEGAYVYFTSGSSGNPKAVLLDGKALENVWRWQGENFKVNNDSVVGWMLNVCFDASLSDIGVALYHGCKLIVLPRKMTGYKTWKKIIDQHAITHIDMPPSLLEVWSNQDLPNTLETIVIGGEMAGQKTIEKMAGKINLVNVYGPTECTICTSLAVFNDKSNPSWIGKPAPHVLYKIDGECPTDNKIGELWIGGSAVALSYFGDKKLTSERFVYKNENRYFKSGDIVKFKNNQFFYMGRNDRQKKLNGQMINLDEIEQVIKKKTPDRVVVEMIKNQIVVFCDSIPLCCDKDKIKNSLPSWVRIHDWVKIKNWPKGTSGKIDRRKIVNDFMGNK